MRITAILVQAWSLGIASWYGGSEGASFPTTTRIPVVTLGMGSTNFAVCRFMFRNGVRLTYTSCVVEKRVLR